MRRESNSYKFTIQMRRKWVHKTIFFSIILLFYRNNFNKIFFLENMNIFLLILILVGALISCSDLKNVSSITKVHSPGNISSKRSPSASKGRFINAFISKIRAITKWQQHQTKKAATPNKWQAFPRMTMNAKSSVKSTGWSLITANRKKHYNYF